MTNAEYRKSPEFMKEISFKELVKSIDAKWGHTYETPKVESDHENLDEIIEEETLA